MKNRLTFFLIEHVKQRGKTIIQFLSFTYLTTWTLAFLSGANIQQMAYLQAHKTSLCDTMWTCGAVIFSKEIWGHTQLGTTHYVWITHLAASTVSKRYLVATLHTLQLCLYKMIVYSNNTICVVWDCIRSVYIIHCSLNTEQITII